MQATLCAFGILLFFGLLLRRISACARVQVLHECCSTSVARCCQSADSCLACLGCEEGADAQQCCCCSLQLLLLFAATILHSAAPSHPIPRTTKHRTTKRLICYQHHNQQTTGASRGIQRACAVIVAGQAHKMPQGAGSHPAHALHRAENAQKEEGSTMLLHVNNAATTGHKLTQQPHELACKTGFIKPSICYYTVQSVDACCQQLWRMRFHRCHCNCCTTGSCSCAACLVGPTAAQGASLQLQAVVPASCI
jgi:hypothetical protein